MSDINIGTYGNPGGGGGDRGLWERGSVLGGLGAGADDSVACLAVVSSMWVDG